MSIFSDSFYVYERLASAKMMSLVNQINSHNHDGTYGVKLLYANIDYANGTIPAAHIGAKTITGGVAGALSKIADKTINADNIEDGSLTWDLFDTTTIHMDGGYAVYAP